jgi:hypothetical protein
MMRESVTETPARADFIVVPFPFGVPDAGQGVQMPPATWMRPLCDSVFVMLRVNRAAIPAAIAEKLAPIRERLG